MGTLPGFSCVKALKSININLDNRFYKFGEALETNSYLHIMPEKHEANLIEILLARNEYAFWNIADFAKCERCRTINTITLEMGELKKQV